MALTFLLNGETVEVQGIPPTRTLLDYLRESKDLTGTKEGCNEGDCGACSVMISDAEGHRALNACILFLPQLAGKAITTVEGLTAPDGTLHPVQQALIDNHGSQCGFCTPGFAVTMATAHLNGATDHDTQLAGNLCRCTGYAPIVRAAKAAAAKPVPTGFGDADLPFPHPHLTKAAEPGKDHALDAYRPETADDLARWYLDHPDATLIAGATDVGLWVTKGFRELGETAFLNGCTDMQRIEETEDGIRIGAGVTLSRLIPAVSPHHPDLARMLNRFGSVQVRNAATVGGNIANGSPIGDTPPALIALGATLHLRKGDTRRSLPIEDFFIDYGQQDRAPGEFVEAVSIPRQQDRLKCYKISKRFDQDISAVCGCFSIRTMDGNVVEARIAFGGMAATPRRAAAVEAALVGQPWDAEAVAGAWDAWPKDFQPLSDMRASAEYRLDTARNLLTRYLLEDLGAQVDVRGVSA